MKASEIMAKDLVTVGPETTVKEIASLMTQRRISGVPVVDGAGKLVGILSETDLLHRAETGTERRRKWWLGVFADADSLARDYARSHAQKASDIMSTNVVTVDPNADLGAVAELLDRRRLKRVPVVADGKLVGIITRGDLVRALVAKQSEPKAGAVDDEEVFKAIRERMRREAWLESSLVTVEVAKGVVELTGMVNSAEQRKAMRILAEETPGVTSVNDKLMLKPTSMLL